MNESAVYKKLKDELNKVPKIKVIITTEDFAEEDVTLSLNGAVYVKQGTFDSNGKVEFYVEHIGTYTITCGEKSKTIEVSEVGGIYQAEINDSVIYGFTSTDPNLHLPETSHTWKQPLECSRQR